MPRALNLKRHAIAFPFITLMLAGLLFQLSSNSLAQDTVDNTTSVTVPVNVFPAAITSGDFNNDGKIDFAVVNRTIVAQTGQAIAIVLNAGGGNFQPATFIPIESNQTAYVTSIKTADFNGDGNLDLVTGINSTFDFIQIRFGDGMGHFNLPNPYLYQVGHFPETITVADFNNDGKPDVATANSGLGDQCRIGYAAVFLNNGSGGLIAEPDLAARPRGSDLVAGDFNGDGKQDLAIRSEGDPGCSPQPSGGVVIYLGNGNGTFTHGSEYEANASPAYLETTDLNHDGKLDLVGPSGGTLKTLLGTGTGDFVAGGSFGLGGTNTDVVAADFNLDGNQDVATVNSANAVIVAFGNGVGGFLGLNTFSTGSNPFNLVAADFDGNGRSDIAATNYNSNTVTVILDVSSQPFIPTRTQFDFDGDQKADIAVYREGATTGAPSYWHILRSADNTYQGIQLGANGDKPVPADYDGDGKTEPAVWRPSNGTWYTSPNPAINYGAFQWGQSGDIPLPEDFDADLKADYVVFRPSNGTWYAYKSSNGFQMLQFGTSTDKPVIGDFDGDGKADYAFYRPGATPLASSTWRFVASTNGTLSSTQFGRGEDLPVPADYDGDRATNIAVFRPSNNTWYTSLSPATNYGATVWGASGDIPAPADYDHDGKADDAVFRPNSSAWYILRSSNGTLIGQQWGVPSDRPVPSSFIP